MFAYSYRSPRESIPESNCRRATTLNFTFVTFLNSITLSKYVHTTAGKSYCHILDFREVKKSYFVLINAIWAKINKNSICYVCVRNWKTLGTKIFSFLDWKRPKNLINRSTATHECDQAPKFMWYKKYKREMARTNLWNMGSRGDWI